MAEPTVEYKPQRANSDVEAGQVRVNSPTKNRYKGTPVGDHGTRRPSKIPILFERSARSWWNPKFDSEILEDEFRKRSFIQIRRRFQYALAYIILACILWCIFFDFMKQGHWLQFVIGSGCLLFVCVLVFCFTFTPFYQNYVLHTSIFLSLILCLFCMMNFIYEDPDLSALGTFTGTIEIIMMMYTVIPLPLFLSVTLGIIYSVILEVLSGLTTQMNSPNFIAGRALLHLCIHLIGVHVFIMLQVRKRSTFLKVCQSVITRRDLEVEKQLKQKMIHSLMPAQVAQSIIKARDEEEAKKEDDENGPCSQKRHSSSGKVNPEKGIMKFRTFHMDTADDVSILFADIVGFTKMSSNKTAEHLVNLLNDLFGRFDILCQKCGCEKISTLGDCYYCVSGCPERRPDHASCCVAMGLKMCIAIQEFDRDHNEEVNMRVGVHTGTVLCGLVGTRRFKFDVWSHDVTLANTMESDGKPGLVHISESTFQFVKDKFEVEAGEPVEDIRKHKVLIEYYNKEKQGYDIKHVKDKDTINTYFVTGHKNPPTANNVAESKDVAAAEDVSVAEKPAEEGESQETPSDGLVEKSTTNHTDGQADGVKTAVLLGQRENLTTSIENLQDQGGEANTALMEQIQAQRDIREKTDKQLVSCMQDSSGVDDYLYRPPINRCTVNFLSEHFETQYRNKIKEEKGAVPTFAMPRFSALFDVIVSVLFLGMISACIFLGFPLRVEWLVFFGFAIALEIIMILPLLCDVCIGGSSTHKLYKIGQVFAAWIPRHIFGAVIASLPVAAVYCNFKCSVFETVENSDMFYCLVLVASLLHYCNFTMLSSWMKSLLAAFAGLVLLVLLTIGICGISNTSEALLNATSATTLAPYVADSTANLSLLVPAGSNVTEHIAIFSGEHRLKYEIILNMAILLLLIFFLNREFEIAYRLSFHGDVQAQMDSVKMQEEKEQADWLLHNIIPEHVSDVLKKTSKYCKNHKDVGVIFAKIVNYDDFYDESFEGGKEYLRVLNELMGDFEDLFDDPAFKDVEKIKTIGACLMAASGLNPMTRNQNKDPDAHLFALMEFSLQMLEKLKQFNAEIFNFDFELAIGYNFGEVTAGVIGTTKLLYDIWGDTVNISSRMYSTGMDGRIQVTEQIAKRLEKHFEFEYRGKIAVKGKGDMNTYLLVKKREGATWE